MVRIALYKGGPDDDIPDQNSQKADSIELVVVVAKSETWPNRCSVFAFVRNNSLRARLESVSVLHTHIAK